MNTTTNLQLKTYNDSDNPSFLEYRKSLNDDANSNMTKIDDFAGDIQGTVDTHIGDTTVHITSTERNNWNSKVDGNRVLTNVPAGALFTDTLTTINGKTGIILKDDIVALGIPSQDTTTIINGKTGIITKDDIVALGIPAQDTITSINDKTGIILKEDIVALGIPDENTITSINGKTGVIYKEDIVALGIPAQDTVYTHPSSHPASMITQDTTHIFVTQTQIDTWNAKETTAGAQTKADIALASAKSYTDTKVAGISGGVDPTWKYAITRYQENLSMTANVAWNVKVPFSTGGYVPKKVLIFSRETRNGNQVGDAKNNLMFEIIKETNGTFSMNTSAYYTGNGVGAGVVRNFYPTANTTNMVFFCTGTTFTYGIDCFLSDYDSTYSVSVGYFTYDATGLSFQIYCNKSQYTAIDLYGYIY